MLDADLLVMKSIDDLFKRKAPAALRRQADANHPDGARIKASTFRCRNGKWATGINAGVMVLNPSQDHFEQMLKDLARDDHDERERTHMPEQDYLTRFYVNRGCQWRNLGVQWNYQIHQLAFTDREGYEHCTRLRMDLEDVNIVHFSAMPKPRDFFHSGEETVYRFVENKMLPAYVRGFDTDKKPREASYLSREVFTAQMRAASVKFTQEWHQVLENLKDERLDALIEQWRQVKENEPAKPPRRRQLRRPFRRPRRISSSELSGIHSKRKSFGQPQVHRPSQRGVRASLKARRAAAGTVIGKAPRQAKARSEAVLKPAVIEVKRKRNDEGHA